MKKMFLILISFIVVSVGLCTLTTPTNFASAEVKYLRVITEDTPFYKNVADSEPLFFLPYTYYVKVLSQGEIYSHVECSTNSNTPSIDGYVPTDMLFYDGLDVTNPYVNVKVKTATTTILFEDSTTTTPLQYVFAEREMAFYGKLTSANGMITYYVSYNNRLGYVKESDVYPFLIENHPNELTFIKPEQPPETTPEDTQQSVSEDGLLSIKLIIIGCLFFAGTIGLILAVKSKSKHAPAVTFYDENDYE